MSSLLTDSTEHGTPWEPNGCSSSLELRCNLRLYKVDNYSTNSLPLVPILRQIQSKFWNPIIFNTHFNIISHLCLGLSRDLFPSGYQKNCCLTYFSCRIVG